MPMSDKDAAAAFRGYAPDRQRQLLGRLSPEQKTKLKGILQANPVGPSSEPAPAAQNPQTFKEKARSLVLKASDYLPMAGGVAGGFLGGAVATPADVVAGPVPTAAGAVVGAGLGGSFGEAAKQATHRLLDPNDPQRTEGQRMIEMGKEGAIQAGSEVLGQATMEALAPALSKTIDSLYYAAKVPKGDNGLIESVIGDLTHTAKASGKPPTSLKQLSGLIDDTQSRLGQEYETALTDLSPHNPNGLAALHQAVDGHSVAERIEALADESGAEKRFGKDGIVAIRNAALQYKKELTGAQLQDIRNGLNKKLQPFYGLSQEGRNNALAHNPLLNVELEEVGAVRDALYPVLDTASGKAPGYFKAQQERLGKLKDLSGLVKDRFDTLDTATKAARGAPLSEKGKITAYGSSSGVVRAQLKNVQAIVKKPNELAGPDGAVRKAFGTTYAASRPKRIGAAVSLSARMLGHDEEQEDQDGPVTGPADARRRLAALNK